ncbi:MAG: hypothetical protein GC179_21490 [Anaerolineaceae bacterium]|nr:hypothetical protein [Anaerolineaceae bacterium]
MHAARLSLKSTALSGFSRTSTLYVLSIQRLAPSHPPVISAENMQIVQFPPQPSLIEQTGRHVCRPYEQ